MNKIHCHIDFPKIESIEATTSEFRGWLLNRNDEDSISKVVLSDGVSDIELINVERKDVKRAHPNKPVFCFDQLIDYSVFIENKEIYLKVFFGDSFELKKINKLTKPLDKSKLELIKNKIEGVKDLLLSEDSLEYSLNFEPRPLIDPVNKIVLMWSAKSGCTFAIKWFLYQMGLLEEANEMFWWVHSYREKVFYDKPFYKEALQEIVNNPDYKVIKVTRNPFTRVVSSYIHALRFEYENNPISKYLKREVNDENTFSFREFLNYLKESCYVRRCNIHHQRQYHPLEENDFVKIDYLIHLEDSMTKFTEIESKLGLKKFDLKSVRKQPHHTEKVEFDTFCADVLFTKSMIEDGKKVPDYKMFFNEEIKQLIVEIYKEDFDHYGY